MAPADNLELLVERIADGAPIDWMAASALCDTDADREDLGNLKLIADLCELHRTPQPDGSTVPASLLQTTDVSNTSLTTWGDMRVSQLLGRGAFGEVYLAHDEQLRRPVALKLLRHDLAIVPGLEESILDEGRRLASIRHPNVVTVFGADVRHGRAGFWMEYLRGSTLEDALKARGPFEPAEAARVGRDICDALTAVHGAGIIHRDVKARNIVQEKDGKVVLMDFGAGMEMHRLERRDADRVGTPMYLAPEVLEGSPASVTSDVYAVGILLFHLLTGKYPYKARTMDTLRVEHRAGRREPLQHVRADLPAPLVHIVDRALAEKPEQRYASAAEMSAALSGIVDRAARHPRMKALLAGSAVVVAGTMLVKSLMPFGGATLPRTIAVPQLTLAAGTTVDDSLPPGLTHEIVRELQRRGIQVRGSMSSPVMAGMSLGEIQTRTSADGVLKGTIANGEHEKLRVTMNLLRADDGQSIWTGTFTPKTDELPEISAMIAAGVVKALGGSSQVAARQVVTSLAYDHYLRGRFLAERRSKESLTLAVQSFKDAIAADPTYAQPWVGLADAYVALGVPAFGTLRPQEARRLARQAVLKALDLDPQSGEAHCTLGFISYFQDWSWKEAENEFRRGLMLNPEYAMGHDWYGDYLLAMGHFPDAMTQIQRARQIEPLSALLHRDVGWHYFFMKQYDDAIAQLRETLDMDPGFGAAHSLLGRALFQKGQFDEGLDELTKGQLPRATYLAFVAYGEAAAGRESQAREHLREALEAGRVNGAYLSPSYVAHVYTALGDQEQAMDWLERGYDQSDFTLVNVYTDPRYEPLRSNPRYKELIEKMGFVPAR